MISVYKLLMIAEFMKKAYSDGALLLRFFGVLGITAMKKIVVRR